MGCGSQGCDGSIGLIFADRSFGMRILACSSCTRGLIIETGEDCGTDRGLMVPTSGSENVRLSYLNARRGAGELVFSRIGIGKRDG